ncbi:MAG TPA: hypothetical protein PLL20_20040 [Phycisphaerae bacterium]|nr:hypothetical protein [Phycisphaerae bacterium]HRR87330.1 hypothetical protein [Phycisphaerae bacterium]
MMRSGGGCDYRCVVPTPSSALFPLTINRANTQRPLCVVIRTCLLPYQNVTNVQATFTAIARPEVDYFCEPSTRSINSLASLIAR